jgi:hypothetical protein
VNEKGEVVGIAHAQLRNLRPEGENGADSLKVAIASNVVRDFLERHRGPVGKGG